MKTLQFIFFNIFVISIFFACDNNEITTLNESNLSEISQSISATPKVLETPTIQPNLLNTMEIESQPDCETITGPEYNGYVEEAFEDQIDMLNEYIERLKDSNCINDDDFLEFIEFIDIPTKKVGNLILIDPNFINSDEFLSKNSSELIDEIRNFTYVLPLVKFHYLERAIKLDPSNWEAYYLRAELIALAYEHLRVDLYSIEKGTDRRFSSLYMYPASCVESISSLPAARLYPYQEEVGLYIKPACIYPEKDYTGIAHERPYFKDDPGLFELVWALRDIEKAFELTQTQEITAQEKLELHYSRYQIISKLSWDEEEHLNDLGKVIDIINQNSNIFLDNNRKCTLLKERIEIVEDQIKYDDLSHNKLMMIKDRRQLISLYEDFIKSNPLDNELHSNRASCNVDSNYPILSIYYFNLTTDEFKSLHPDSPDNTSQLSYSIDFINKYKVHADKYDFLGQKKSLIRYIYAKGLFIQYGVLTGSLSKSDLDKTVTEFSELVDELESFYGDYSIVLDVYNQLNMSLGWLRFIENDYSLANNHFFKASENKRRGDDVCTDKRLREMYQDGLYSYCDDAALYMEALTYELAHQNMPTIVASTMIDKKWSEAVSFVSENEVYLEEIIDSLQLEYRGWSDKDISELLSLWEVNGFFK